MSRRRVRRVGKGALLRAVPTSGRAANTDRGVSVFVGTPRTRLCPPYLLLTAAASASYVPGKYETF
jgi:hypothetical protein